MSLITVPPPENSIGAIHNWHDKPIWEHYQIKNGKAQQISEAVWFDLYDTRKAAGIEVLPPLYVGE
jgi:hypothetical protein